MKICNVVAILSISCLLPNLAQTQDNAITMATSTCENELGQCIDKTDTHKCMFPLAKLECPDGKQCCKTYPTDYDSAALPLTKWGYCCINSDDTITKQIHTLKDHCPQLYHACKGGGGGGGNKHCQMSYGDSCYFISSSTAIWSKAQEICVQMGGNLVKIDSDGEFNFLKAKVTSDTWIGLNDIKHEGHFTWISDGSTLVNQNWWFPGEPNDYNTGEDCAHFWAKHHHVLLNDENCKSRHYHYICEM